MINVIKGIHLLIVLHSQNYSLGVYRNSGYKKKKKKSVMSVLLWVTDVLL